VPPVNLPVKMEFRYEIEVSLYSDILTFVSNVSFIRLYNALSIDIY